MTSSHPTDRSHDDRARRLMRLESLFDAALAVPETQRDAFLLHVEAGLALDEIAHVAAAPVETIKSRLRYAYGKLRGALEDLR